MDRLRLVQLAKREIDERRNRAESICEKNLTELRADGEYRLCEKALRQAEVEYSVSAKETDRKKAKERMAVNTQKMRKILQKHGFSEEDLRPRYSCGKCEDTGFINGKTCSCLREEMRKIIVSESNINNPQYTFENSKETNADNLTVYKKAQKAVGEGKNILLVGNTGSGKTYLLTCCANLALRQNKTVLFVTAYALNSMLLSAHLSDVASKQALLDALTDADVLAIDDLGTEIVYKNVTSEYLFAVFNERVTNKKATYFSTNLSLRDLRERYDERMFSRIVDQQSTLVAKLTGEDKRLNKV